MNQRDLTLLMGIGIVASLVSGCINAPAALAQLLEARRLASELHVEFTKATDAANRAVMADADDSSKAAAGEARQARQVVERDVQALRQLLQSLGYRDDLRDLDGFAARFAEYRQLDDEILPLAVENTNVKAQRLSFGPAREAADAFRSALDRAVSAAGGQNRCQSEVLAMHAVSALRNVQVLHAPHIAEADLAAMSRMELQMAASEAEARHAVHQLKAALPAASAPHLAGATAALDRFSAINKELILLSRRNSDVQSLALSLGRKRTVTAACEEQLQALEHALAGHEVTRATR